MASKFRKQCRSGRGARRIGCRWDRKPRERLIRGLDLLLQDPVRQRSPIEEQLQRCPEAFQAGELIERIFDAAGSGDGEATDQGKLLPPAGAVMPPLV